MKTFVMCAAVASLAIVASSASALELQVMNKSKSSLHHLYLSPGSQKSWGPDQLGSGSSDVVAPGNGFRLHGIEAGTYDVKVVTEEGTECEVDDAEFDESKEWVITEHMLEKC
jgi:hypothetical protein